MAVIMVKLNLSSFPLFTSTSLIGGRGPTLLRLREVEVEAVANAPYIILAGHPPAGYTNGKGPGSYGHATGFPVLGRSRRIQTRDV